MYSRQTVLAKELLCPVNCLSRMTVGFPPLRLITVCLTHSFWNIYEYVSHRSNETLLEEKYTFASDCLNVYTLSSFCADIFLISFNVS